MSTSSADQQHPKNGRSVHGE
jgi:hypothetical protein